MRALEFTGAKSGWVFQLGGGGGGGGTSSSSDVTRGRAGRGATGGGGRGSWNDATTSCSTEQQHQKIRNINEETSNLMAFYLDCNNE